MRISLTLAGTEVGYVELTPKPDAFSGAEAYIAETRSRLTPDGTLLRARAGGVNLGVLVDSPGGMSASRRLNAREYADALSAGEARVTAANQSRGDEYEPVRDPLAELPWTRITELPDWIPEWLAPEFDEVEYIYESEERGLIACPFSPDRPFPLVCAMSAVTLATVKGERCGVAGRDALCR